jgi:CRISPR-associated exonuclease Cas4
MTITATHINYYYICHRKLWLFSNGIQMEHTSDIVTEGKLIGEYSYTQRPQKTIELQFDSIKIDFYDPKNKVVHEIKKSDKVEEAHIAQVKYYIYILQKNGIDGATGLIEYPKLRHTTPVFLLQNDIVKIQQAELDIVRIITDEKIPEPINKKICQKCSYYDFCYV